MEALKVGDPVVVTNRSDYYEGLIGTVTELASGSDPRVGIRTPTGKEYAFFQNQLKKIVEPARNKFEVIAERLGKLVTEKNAAYGNSAEKTSQILAVLYPSGVAVEQYKYMQLVTRICDKLARLAEGHLEDTGDDIAGYGMLIAAMAEKTTEAK